MERRNEKGDDMRTVERAASVSFIIPAYNASTTLERCLKSIQGLDYPKEKREIIVVDNGSTDGTAAIAGKLGATVVGSDKKISGTRNIGAKRATADILAFVDADCIVQKNWLAIGMTYFDDPDNALVGSRTNILTDNATWVEKTWKIHRDRYADKSTAKWFGPIAMLVRKEAFFKIGGFNESLETCEDVDFGYRIGKKYKVINDTRMAAVHLGEDKTALEFFHKEMWRGKGSMKTSLMHLDEPKELIGLAALFYYSVLIFIGLPFAIAAMVMSADITYVLAVAAGFFLPITFVAFDTCQRTGAHSYFSKLFFMYCIYIIARILALFR